MAELKQQDENLSGQVKTLRENQANINNNKTISNHKEEYFSNRKEEYSPPREMSQLVRIRLTDCAWPIAATSLSQSHHYEDVVMRGSILL